VNELIEQVLPLVSHLARTGGIVIKTELQESLPWISLDPNQIKQVLLNIIHNAFQAMLKGGTLFIQTMLKIYEPNYQTSNVQQSLNNRFDNRIGSLPVDVNINNSGKKIAEWIAIIIADTGEGIPLENIERIFEPFFSTRPSGKGTGLGLSVSYGIISSHNGFIDVESQPNKGSRFTIYLPLKRNNTEEYPFVE
jgi:signal transduction histidine kinase